MPHNTAPTYQASLDSQTIASERSLAVIDTTVTHWESIASGLPAGMEILLLKPGQDGLSQLREWADSHSGYAAIHVFSHGDAGGLHLAGSRYAQDSLDARADDWAAIGQALHPDGDLLLYGCHSGAQQGFIDKLASLTQADIAASRDLTGNAAAGGNWVLERQSGQIEATTFQLDSFAGVLAPVNATFDFGTGTDSSGATSQSYANNGETIIFSITASQNAPASDSRLFVVNEAGQLGTDVNGMDGRVLATNGTNDLVKTVRITVDGNKTFDLDSFSFFDFQSADSQSAASITLTSVNGSWSFIAGITTTADQINLSSNNDFKAVAYVDVSCAGGFFPTFDNVVLKNITALGGPTVTSVSSTTNNGSYKAGDTIAITVQFSESVNVTGTPQLTLETGSTDRVVNYASGSGSNTLTFNYTVQAGDSATDLDYLSTSALALNGGSIKNAANTDAVLTLAVPGAANSLGANKAIVIDGVAPAVTNVSASTANGSYKAGDVIAITVQFSETVNVTGTPQLTLETGSTDRVVNYTSGTGSNTLTFNYTVQAGDSSADLDYLSTSALALNGGTIQDAAGNNATLALAAPGAANSLGANKALVIDAAAPTVTNVSATTADGSYEAGDTIYITVTFSEAVTLNSAGGWPTLRLETGISDQFGIYHSGSGTNTLTFEYFVQNNDTSTDLDYTATNALQFNGSTIKDAAGNDAILTLPTPGTANSLGANKAILINQPPTILSATYDAASGALVVNAASLTAASGATNDIIANKFTLSGEGGETYTLTDTSNVEISSATSFTLNLSATDKAAANLILNKNGTSSTSGTTFNLAAAEDWAAGASASLNIADLTGNGITVSNVAAPAITSATYDYSSNTLVVTGSGFLRKSGASNDIDISKLSITGQGGASYTLTSASGVEVSSGTSFSITLSGSDLVNVEALLNKNGTTAQDSTTFNLAAAEDWAAGADASVVVADTTGNGITVSNWTAPVISSSAFDWATGQLTLTGSNFVPASGAANDVVASKFTFTGEGGATYTLTDSSQVEISSDSSATLTLSATDLLAVRGLLSKNGTQSPDNTAFNLAAADDWLAGSPASENIADATTGITVSNVGTPTITSASYDTDTGVLSVTGSNLFRKPGAANDVDISLLTLTGGTGNATYTLTSASDVEISSATSFSITLSGADKTAVDALLDQLGTSSTGGSTYNLAAADNWLAGADSASDISDASNAVTVSVNPKLSSATYNASTGTLVVTGSNLQAKTGAHNDIDASLLTLKGEGGETYTLTDTADVEIDSATQFTLTLSATDKAAANLLLNKNGTASTGGTTFNLAAADDWNTQVTAGDTADASNGVTVSNVAAPAITSATYNAATGVLLVTGTGLLKRDGAVNDIVASKFTLSGEGGATYTLTDSANVEITSGTSFSLTLSTTDRAAANLILNKNGTTSTGGTAFNLAAAEDWAAGADAAVVIADTTGNAVTVSNVAVPTLTSATYNESSGVLTVTGTGFLKRDGAANDIDVGKLQISGDSTPYTLTSGNVEISSATSFSITLNATDKSALATRLNKDGSSSTGNISYNLAALEDWAAGADTAITVADLTGNGITVTLTPPAPVTPPASNTDDKDGVPDTVENKVPVLLPVGGGKAVEGDGNGDGLADSAQANVSSVGFLNTTTAQSNPGDAKQIYVTLVSDSSSGKTGATATAALSDVKQLDKPADAPADLSMPLGLIAFKADAGSAGASKNFSLYVDSSVSVNGYWKKVGNDWVNLASQEFGGKVVTEGGKTRLDFTIVDGGKFDSDGKKDGVITDPGAIGFRTASIDSDNDQFPDALEAANGLKVGIKDNDVFTNSKFFVMQLYRDFLLREAEPEGLAVWKNQLDSGLMNRAQIAHAFMNSVECQSGAAAISRLNLGTLGKQAEKAELDSQVELLRSGKNLSQLASDFFARSDVASQFAGKDNAAFVGQLYTQVLGRQGEAAGVQAWKGLLDGGMARSQVLLGFTESAEFKALSDQRVKLGMDYLCMLERTPDAAGYANWLGMTQQWSAVEIIGHFINSPEYHDRFLP